MNASPEVLTWPQVFRCADDCDALYDSGIARVGQSVYIRLNGVMTRSTHATEIEAMDAYIESQSLVGGAL